MKDKLISALKLNMQPIAVFLTDERPEDGLHFKEEHTGGCVASMLVAAGKQNRVAFFGRSTFGCPGGGTGLGFGDRYGKFPIACLLSTGNKEFAERMGRAGAAMAEGERLYKTPELARKWVDALPITDVPSEYVVFKPWSQVTEADKPELIVFFVNADQLSALVVLADYHRGTHESVTAPFGAACQSILYGYAEADKEQPRGVIGFFDITKRELVDRETLTFTVPYSLYKEMESNAEGSFLELSAWQRIRERQ
jgi:uncharacterized protein (DUF169 family)